MTKGRIVRGQGVVVPGPVADLRADAERLRQEARRALESLEKRSRAAEQELSDLRRQAEAEGRQAGYEVGLQKAAAEAREIRNRAAQEAAVHVAQARELAIPLGRKLAEKIVGKALVLDSSLVAQMAEDALAVLRVDSGAVVLRCSQSDLDRLQAARDQLTSALGPQASLTIEPDPSLQAGDCIVDSRSGRADARISHKLDGLERVLRDV